MGEQVKKYLISNPFIFLPFNAGPRTCLGQQVWFSPRLVQVATNLGGRRFVYEISFMIIRILQAFEDIIWDPEASPQSLPPPQWATSENLRQGEGRSGSVPTSQSTSRQRINFDLQRSGDVLT